MSNYGSGQWSNLQTPSYQVQQPQQQQSTVNKAGGSRASSSNQQYASSNHSTVQWPAGQNVNSYYQSSKSGDNGYSTGSTASASNARYQSPAGQYSANLQNYQSAGMPATQGNSFNGNQYYNVASGYYSGNQAQAPSMGTTQPYNTYNQSQQNWSQSYQETARNPTTESASAPASGSPNWSNAVPRTSSATGSVNQSAANNWKPTQAVAPSSNAVTSNSPLLQTKPRPTSTNQTAKVPKASGKTAESQTVSVSTIGKPATPKPMGRPKKNDKPDSERRPVGRPPKQIAEATKTNVSSSGMNDPSDASQHYQAYVDPRDVSKAPNPAPIPKTAATNSTSPMPIDPSFESLLSKATGDGENEFNEIEEEMTDLLSRLQEYRSKDPTRFTAFWNKLKKIPGKANPQAATTKQDPPTITNSSPANPATPAVATPSSKAKTPGAAAGSQKSATTNASRSAASTSTTPAVRHKVPAATTHPSLSKPVRPSAQPAGSPPTCSAPSTTTNARATADALPNISATTAEAKVSAKALKLKYLIERMPENSQKGNVDLVGLEDMIRRDVSISDIAISLRRRGLALPALSVIDQQITEAGQEFQRKFDMASAALKEKNQPKSQANSAKKRVPGSTPSASSTHSNQDITTPQVPAGYYAPETGLKAASKSATPVQAAMSKEEQSRKRKIADIIDISISSDEDDDIRPVPPARPAPMQAQSPLSQTFQQRTSLSSVTGLQSSISHANTLQTNSTHIAQSRFTQPPGSNAGQMPPPMANPVPKELPKPVLPLPLTPQEIVAAEQRRKRTMTVAPQLPEKARNTTYNPATIARDFLISKGEHPTEKMLNAHFLDLKNNFKSADWRIDLNKIEWDIVDPGGPTPEELKVLRSRPAPKLSPPREIQSLLRPQALGTWNHFKSDATPTRGSQPVVAMATSPSQPRATTLAAAQSPKSVNMNSQKENKPVTQASDVSSFMPINAASRKVPESVSTPVEVERDAQTSSPHAQPPRSQPQDSAGSPANSMHSAPRKRGRPFTKNNLTRPPVVQTPAKPIPASSTIDLLAEPAPAFHAIESTPVARPRRGRPPVRGLGTGLTRNDAALHRGSRGGVDVTFSDQSDSNTPHVVSAPGPTRGSRGRPRGSRAGGPARGRPRGGRLGYVPAQRREKTPEDGIAIKVPSANAIRPLPVDEDLDFTDPMLMRGKLPMVYPAHDKDQRNYQIFDCEWTACSAKLHNLDTLKKHVAQLHLKPQVLANEDGADLHCDWGSCSDLVFGTTESLVQHIAQHITEKGARLGEGPIIESSRATSKAYLYGPDGQQVIPLIALGGPPDPLPADASFKMTNVYHKAHGNNTLRERAIAEEISRLRRIEQDGIAVNLPDPSDAVQAMIDDDVSEIYVTDAEGDDITAPILPSTPESTLQLMAQLANERIAELANETINAGLFMTIDELAATDDIDW